MEEEKKGIGLFGLIGLVVSSCIGSGVFALTGQIGQVAAPGSALVAWGVVGVGFLALALSFANLGAKRSDLHGIFSYAEEGFGKFSGFISGWGYWLSAWLGNVAFATILMSTLGFFLPYFLPGNNIGSIVVASVIMWGITFLVIRGVESAAFLNAIVMIAKVVPIVVFILFLIPGLPKDTFTYLVPLTDMNMRTFLLLSNIGRIPGILVSTYAADGLIDGRFAESAILFAVAAVIAVLGIVFQKRIMKFLEMRSHRDK